MKNNVILLSFLNFGSWREPYLNFNYFNDSLHKADLTLIIVTLVYRSQVTQFCKLEGVMN